MTRRVLVRLAIAAGCLALVAIGGLAVLIAATSTPQLPPPPLPTATAGPVVDPNRAMAARIALGMDVEAAQTSLRYEDTLHPNAVDPGCGQHGRWSLDVNPQDVIGYPVPASPDVADWKRAAGLINHAETICRAAVLIRWFGSSPISRTHPTSARWSRWIAAIPITLAPTITAARLQRDALKYAQPA